MRISGTILLNTLLLSCNTGAGIIKSDATFLPVKTISISKHTTLIAPKNYDQGSAQYKKMESADYQINLYARKFVHGDIIYLELIPSAKNKFDEIPSFIVDKKQFLLTSLKWGYRGFFVINPEENANSANISIAYKLNGIKKTCSHDLFLEKKEFPVYKTALNLGKYSRTDLQQDKIIQEKIQYEAKIKEKLFSALDPDHIKSSTAYPRDFHRITSPFYAKRIYDQYEMLNGRKISREPKISVHRGLDFYAQTGAPIYAMIDGKVVVAENLYFEGNCVWIDHGNKILSVYMHMSKLNTYTGQMVKAGHLIGFAGSTGMATGPHLHVSLYISGISADPLSLLFLPVRE